MKNIVIGGVGSYLPANIVTNNDLSKIVDTNDEWIKDRTGIEERRLSKGEDTSYMAAEACKKAIDNAGISPLEIDLIVLATCTPDMFIPSSACMVQKYIGAKNAFAFDINAACTGFIYGLNIAQSLMKTNGYKYALVVGSETLSKSVDWTDRGTCVLFGDGAGAAVLSSSDELGIIDTDCKAEGDKFEFLKMGAVDINTPFGKGIDKNPYLEMNGSEVFKFATTVITKSVNDILNKNNMSIEDVDYIIPHQANMRIIDYSAKKLKTSKNKFFTNIDKYGNTSAASIPIALSEIYEKGILTKGMKIILVGFGGGLTYGASLIEWHI